jgi:hypothetical protein
MEDSKISKLFLRFPSLTRLNFLESPASPSLNLSVSAPLPTPLTYLHLSKLQTTTSLPRLIDKITLLRSTCTNLDTVYLAYKLAPVSLFEIIRVLARGLQMSTS